MEARGGVLFRDEAYRLIPTAGGKDFGREAMEELMTVTCGVWRPGNDLRRVRRQNGKVPQRKSRTEISNL